MGWAHCGQDKDGRDIGYAITAECDEPDCFKVIDRGLAHVCGGMHGGEEENDFPCCGKYFCGDHLTGSQESQICQRCYNRSDDDEEYED